MSSGNLNFEKQHFESPEKPTQDWLDWFRDEFGRRLYKIDVEPDPDTPFKLAATTRMLPDLAISLTDVSRMRVLHRGGVSDDISIVVPLAGTITGEVEGRQYELKPGMAVLGRHGAPSYHECASGTRMLSIRLRRHLFETRVKTPSALGAFAISPDTQAMRLLLGYVQMLDAEEQITVPEVRDLVTLQVHDLAALVFGTNGDAQHVIVARGKRSARMAAIKKDIFDNLASQRLSVAAIARRQDVSSRYVRMLFEREGTTFTEFVLHHRLTRAHRMLCDPRFDGTPIHDIALRTGFGDLSYFNRSFRRQFGMTPSNVRSGRSV
jgi:AraC-like DNA-binding protein